MYCGKELALFKRLRGGEFCSDGHRQRYQEEYTQLALNRLAQTNAAKQNESDSAGAKPKDPRAEPESPALKRRERIGREEIPALPSPASPIIPARLETPAQTQAAQQRTAVLEHDPPVAAAEEIAVPASISVPDSVPEPDATLETVPDSEMEEPPPAGMSNFLVEFPVPVLVDAVPADQSTHLTPAPTLTLPRLQEFPPDADATRLDPAARITLSLFTVTDFPTPPKERGLELREFVRGVPQVEIHVKPAVDSGFEPVKEAVEVPLVGAYLPVGSPGLWQAPEPEFPALSGATEILLGELARLDFALTDWGESARAEDAERASQPPVIGTARLEPMRVEPVEHEPAPRASSRPEPLHFEPVHIDPVFMEKIAGHVRFEAALAQRPVVPEPVPEPVVVVGAAPPALPVDAVPPAPKPAAEPAAELVAEPVAKPVDSTAIAAEPPAPVDPKPAAPAATVTKPMVVTLHGLAPLRGKPVQVFTSSVARAGDLQIPRETGLPLRPIMVLGAAPKPAGVEQPAPVDRTSDKPSDKPAAKAIPIPLRPEPRPDAKLLKSEVRVLPVQVRESVRPESIKPQPVKPEPATPVAPKPQPVREAPPAAARLKETPASPKPAEAPKPAKAPVEIRAAAPAPAQPKPKAPAEDKPKVPVEAKPRVAPAEPRVEPPVAAPVEAMDLLGLPKLSFQQKETFWSRLPAVVRLGAIAAVLALIVGGVVLTSRGSGTAKPVTPVPTEPVMVEEPAFATTAGWTQDWFADRAGSAQGRHVDILRGSLALRDYRLVFEGQILQGALGWVFRADEKSFYVEKIQVITPGHDPVVALVRFAVINGVEQARVQIPLPLQAHLDTTYKVRMDVVGDRFSTWVQDQKVDQWTDTQLAVGGVGLYYDKGDSAKLRDTVNVIPLKRK